MNGKHGVLHLSLILAAASALSCGSRTAQVDASSGGGGDPLAACASAPLRTTGPVYYYCDCQAGAAQGCQTGDDSRDGLTPETARQTVANAISRFNGMAAGSTVAFCRGGVFSQTAGGYFRNASCTAANPCDYRDYTPSGMSGAPRPLFRLGSVPFVDMSNGGHGFRFWNIDARIAYSGNNGDGAYGFWITGSATDVDICNIGVDGAQAGVVEQSTNQRITIRNSQFANIHDMGILAGSNDLLIDSNAFRDCGVAQTTRLHTIYVEGGDPSQLGTTDGYQNERIVNNDFFASLCNAVLVEAHGRHSGMAIENNRIVADNAAGGCYGIEVGGGGYPYAIYMNQVSVRRNRVLLDSGSTAGAARGVAVSNCLNCTVSDNSIALLPLGAVGIDLGVIAARPAGMGGNDSSYADQSNSGSVVQNNSIYLPNVGYGATGIHVNNEGSGYVIENNAVWLGTSATTCVSSAAPTLRVGNNYCAQRGTPAASVLWTNAPEGDFTLASGSPLIGYGSSTHYSPMAMSPAWSPTDAGVARTPPIDAGAFVH